MGEEKLQALLQESLAVATRTEAMKPSDPQPSPARKGVISIIDDGHVPPFSLRRVFPIVLDRLNDALEQLDLAFLRGSGDRKPSSKLSRSMTSPKIALWRFRTDIKLAHRAPTRPRLLHFCHKNPALGRVVEFCRNPVIESAVPLLAPIIRTVGTTVMLLVGPPGPRHVRPAAPQGARSA
jgi:hypothetical protein